MNTECGVESAREANRENCEQRDRQRAKTGAVAQVTRARQWPETAQTLGLRAKKSQPIRVGILNYGGGGGDRTRVRKPSTDRSTYLVR